MDKPDDPLRKLSDDELEVERQRLLARRAQLSRELGDSVEPSNVVELKR